MCGGTQKHNQDVSYTSESNTPAQDHNPDKQIQSTHTCVQHKNMDFIYPNQSDNLQKMVKTKQTDKEYTHMCATSKHGFYKPKSVV